MQCFLILNPCFLAPHYARLRLGEGRYVSPSVSVVIGQTILRQGDAMNKGLMLAAITLLSGATLFAPPQGILRTGPRPSGRPMRQVQFILPEASVSSTASTIPDPSAGARLAPDMVPAVGAAPGGPTAPPVWQGGLLPEEFGRVFVPPSSQGAVGMGESFAPTVVAPSRVREWMDYEAFAPTVVDPSRDISRIPSAEEFAHTVVAPLRVREWMDYEAFAPTVVDPSRDISRIPSAEEFAPTVVAPPLRPYSPPVDDFPPTVVAPLRGN